MTLKPRKCPVCTKMMLVYENPDRLLCPRESRHYKWLSGVQGRQGPRPRRKKKGR